MAIIKYVRLPLNSVSYVISGILVPSRRNCYSCWLDCYDDWPLQYSGEIWWISLLFREQPWLLYRWCWLL